MIVIDISGEMAQFRNFFYNSSVISYPFFPRTSVLGFLASILGREHDSYYDEFKDALIGVCLMTPVTKEIKTHNFLKTDNLKENFHSQMKMEYIRSSSDKRLSYRIFVENHNEQEILDAIENGEGYLRYMGTTECLADIERYEKVEADIIKPTQALYIDSILPISIIEELFFNDASGYFHYEKNRIVHNFESGRISLGTVDILTETKRLQTYAKLKENLSFDISDQNRVDGKLIQVTVDEQIMHVFLF